MARDDSQASSESDVDDRMEIADLLSRVSERQRQVLVLRYIGQLSVSEIAETLHCAEGTVKSTLHSALARTAAKEKEGCTHVGD